MGEVYANIFCGSCLTMRTGKFKYDMATLQEADRSATCCDFPLYLFISKTIVRHIFDEYAKAIARKNPRRFAEMMAKG